MRTAAETRALIADLERCADAMRAYIAGLPDNGRPLGGSAASGAARRASMDATRALARWRQW